MQPSLTVASVAIALAGVLGLSSVSGQTVPVAVVVNERNPVRNVTTSELRKLFAGEKLFWAGGLSVKIIVRTPGTHERIVLLNLLSMTESEYKRYWTGQVFGGQAQSEPVVVFSNGMQKEALAIYPGGLALVDARDVKPGMKVVRVDGRLPGEVGYTLN